MKTPILNSLVLLLFPLLVMPVMAETTRCTAITTLPFIISKQGSYCFIRSLSYKPASGSAMTVNANNVIIDLNGHSLIGTAALSTTDAQGIYAVNRQNITIRNGGIRGFKRGLHLFDSTDSNTASQRHLIEDMHISKSSQYGIIVWGSDIMLRNNRVTDTGVSAFDSIGMYLRGRSGRVLNNDIIRTRATGDLRAIGLLIENSPGAVAGNNRIDKLSSGTGNTFGLRVSNSNNVLATNNHISSADFGIQFDSFSANGKYMDNLTSNVTTPFFGGTAVGTND